jgi:hypothetical protein
VITSRPSHHYKGIYGMETSKIIQPLTMEKNNKKHQARRPGIVILGDSHACRFAGELLCQSNHHLNTTGYVKLNIGLTELLNTAKNDSSKLTRTDTIIMIGGSNDIDKSVHGKNLTSIVNFLDGTQNTNVILVEVPVRYNIGAISCIEQIENYSKKLHKVTKRFKHVKLIKVTTNREHFTKHGLHLNNKGKEIMSKELLKNLSIKHESQKVAAIQLPWKNESTKAGAQIIKNVRLNEILNIDIGAEDNQEIVKNTSKNCIGTNTDMDADLKEALNPNEQQGVYRELCKIPTENNKVISRNTKLQQNCPKVKNYDFYGTENVKQK